MSSSFIAIEKISCFFSKNDFVFDSFEIDGSEMISGLLYFIFKYRFRKRRCRKRKFIRNSNSTLCISIKFIMKI